MTTPATLLAALRTGDAVTRQQAAMQLGAADPRPVMPELVTLMATESDDFVRESLVWAVVSRPEAAVAPLMAALEADVPHEPVLHALSKIADPATRAAIEPFAEDPDPVVAAKAWWALARVGDVTSLPAILRHLGASDAQRRHGVTRALMQFGPAAIDALTAELSGHDPARRGHAAEILLGYANPDHYGTAQRHRGEDESARAYAILRDADAPEVDGALLLATIDDGRLGLATVAAALRTERNRA